MLHERIREERKKRRLSHSDLAHKAGVSRSQLIALEQGGNPTLATVQKTLAQLGLRLNVLPDDSEADAALHAALAMQRHALALHQAAGKLVTALGGTPAPAAVQPAGPLPGGGGAERHEASIPEELLDRLEAAVEKIEQRENARKKV